MAQHPLSVLFDPIALGPVTMRNRIGMSPMCQYSAVDGVVQEWHHAHLGARAQGGLGLIMVEATGVEPQGRITHGCTGLWNDTQRDALKPIAGFIKSQGATAAIQLAHAGRKGSSALPWQGGRQLAAHAGGWKTAAPSAIPFRDGEEAPDAMSVEDIKRLCESFVAAAKRAAAAGFDMVEVHAAHGYLLHSFLSPLCNHREDAYGGPLENRMRFLLEVTKAVKSAMPAHMALAVRLSCSDWAQGGLTVEDCVVVARHLRDLGVHLIDCSSGGAVLQQKIPLVAGYQVPFAEKIRRESDIATAAVGLITTPEQAAGIVGSGQCDMVFLARVLLRDPYWALKAAAKAGVELPVPQQYLRGVERESLLSL